MKAVQRPILVWVIQYLGGERNAYVLQEHVLAIGQWQGGTFSWNVHLFEHTQDAHAFCARSAQDSERIGGTLALEPIAVPAPRPVQIDLARSEGRRAALTALITKLLKEGVPA